MRVWVDDREGKQVGGKIRPSHPQAANNTHHLWSINRGELCFSPAIAAAHPIKVSLQF